MLTRVMPHTVADEQEWSDATTQLERIMADLHEPGRMLDSEVISHVIAAGKWCTNFAVVSIVEDGGTGSLRGFWYPGLAAQAGALPCTAADVTFLVLHDKHFYVAIPQGRVRIAFLDDAHTTIVVGWDSGAHARCSSLRCGLTVYVVRLHSCAVARQLKNALCNVYCMRRQREHGGGTRVL